MYCTAETKETVQNEPVIGIGLISIFFTVTLKKILMFQYYTLFLQEYCFTGRGWVFL